MVDQGAGNLDIAERQAARSRQLTHLGDDPAAAVVGGHGHREHLPLDGLALHGQVAVLVGAGPPDDRDIDGKGVEQQPLLAAQGHDLDEIVGGGGVLLAAGLARVDVGAQADLGHETGPAGGDLPHELGEHALGERVGLDLAGLDECPESRLVADVAADGASLQTGQAELREAALGEVPDPDDAHRGQVARPPLGLVDGGQLVDEALGQGMTGTGAADDDGVAIVDEPDRLADADDLAHVM